MKRHPHLLLLATCLLLCASITGAVASGADEPLPFVLKQTARLDPEIKSPSALTYDARDNLYIAGKTSVKVFNPKNALLREIKISRAATCVAVDDEGAVYAGSRTKIEKYSPKGALLAAWGKKGREPGELLYMTALAVWRDRVYVADSGNRKLARFAINGDFVDERTDYNIPSPYFDCAVDAKGIVYAGHTAEHRVERYDQNGKFLGHWGEFGEAREKFSGCCNPTNIALFPDGRMATAEKGIPRLKVYDAEGRLLAHLGKEHFPPKTAGMDLAVDSKGRIALLEPLKKEVRFYELVPSESAIKKEE